MSTSMWTQLAGALPADAARWRAVEVEPDGSTARLAPEAAPEAVVARLDDVVGRHGWSVRYVAIAQAVACELTVTEVTKSAVVASPTTLRGTPLQDGARLADAALAKAASLFGIELPSSLLEATWAPIDPATGRLLDDAYDDPSEAPDAEGSQEPLVHDPNERAAPPSGSSSGAVAPTGGAAVAHAGDEGRAEPAGDRAEPDAEPGSDAEPIDTRAAAAPLTESADADVGKSAGQRAIDRLVDRLRGEGLGLETAQLLVEHGGYGSDADEARALYGKLRDLLLRETPA